MSTLSPLGCTRISQVTGNLSTAVFIVWGSQGNLDIGQACFKGSRERKVLNSSNVLSYADHSSSCHGTPLPAERARCRTSLIDVIASLEMGMPPLKGLASSLDGAWPASILKPRSLCSPTGCFLGSPSPHQRKQAKLTLEKGGGR